MADDEAAVRTLVLRVWLPDRPGALGLVASRIGAVRGDVLAIDILERGGGQVVDELVISLPRSTPPELLVTEVGAVDGVAVESIREAPNDRPDPAMALLEVGASVAAACVESDDAAVDALGAGVAEALDADWVVVAGDDGPRFGRGDAPDARWLRAFLEGSGHLPAEGVHGPADVLWASLPRAGLTIAAGRASRAVHERERARLRVLAHIVDPLLAESAGDPPRLLRDLASQLSHATTRRAVAKSMLDAVARMSTATVAGIVVLHRRRPEGNLELLGATPDDDDVSTALRTAGHALRPSLQIGASIELIGTEAVCQAIGEGAAKALEVEVLVAHPLVWDEHVNGVVLLGWAEAASATRRPVADDGLADAIVSIGAPALERATRYDVEHEIALTLQRGMLAIPPFDDVATPWSAHYSAAATGLVGGDWYDVIDLGDRTGFAIGDIVGRGIASAVAMGQVRSANRALAPWFEWPHELLDAVDRFASATGCGNFSSMAYLTVDRATGDLAYAGAGHPPPLVIHADGSAEWLDRGTTKLVGRGGGRSTTTLRLRPGATIVLYTDGLVERRGELIDEGLARLLAAAREEAAEDDRANHARRLVARIRSVEGIDDDVAVVFVTFPG